MLGKLPRVVSFSRAGSLLGLLMCGLSVPGNASAADLRLRINPKMERHDSAPPPEKREQLFERFLYWLRSHQG
jgi:hypothetical protein